VAERATKAAQDPVAVKTPEELAAMAEAKVAYAATHLDGEKVEVNPLLLVVKKLPIAVRNYRDQLQAQLGSGYGIKILEVPLCKGCTEFKYEMHVISLAIGTPVSGSLKELVFDLSSKGKLDTKSIHATFYAWKNGEDIQVSDGDLLYAGLGKLSDKPMALFARITVTAVDQAGIHFDLLQKPVAHYRVYRTADGTVVCEPDLKLPPVVQAYVDYLTELFPGYIVKPEVISVVCKNGPCPQQYQITVVDPRKNLDPGHLRELVIQMRELKEQPTVISARFDSIEKVDGALLYAGLRKLSDKPMELLARTTVTAVDQTGIHFDLLQKPVAHYRVYRTADGTVVCVRDPKLPFATQAI